VYADFEPLGKDGGKPQHYRVFRYYVLFVRRLIIFLRFRRDKDCVAWFAEELRDLEHNVKTIISANIPREFHGAKRLDKI